MTSSFVTELKTLINFGIRNTEKLTPGERRNRMASFRKEVSIDKYRDLFNSLQDYFLNEEVPSEEKSDVIILTIEFIRYFPALEDNITFLPSIIQKLYSCHMNLYKIMFMFEYLESREFTCINDFNTIMLDYLDYLDNSENDFYIHNCYSKIKDFNDKIFGYLNKCDYNGIRHRDNINKPELISQLESKFNQLDESRKN